jgi:hypothetical protein
MVITYFFFFVENITEEQGFTVSVERADFGGISFWVF